MSKTDHSNENDLIYKFKLNIKVGEKKALRLRVIGDLQVLQTIRFDVSEVCLFNKRII